MYPAQPTNIAWNTLQLDGVTKENCSIPKYYMKHTLHNSCGNNWRMQTVCVKHITGPEQLMISIISTQPLHKWPIFKVKTAWLKHLLKSRNLKESAFAPTNSRVLCTWPNWPSASHPICKLPFKTQDIKQVFSFHRQRMSFPSIAHFKDPWGFLPFNVDLPCRNPFMSSYWQWGLCDHYLPLYKQNRAPT
jgi:hypothetical protein